MKGSKAAFTFISDGKIKDYLTGLQRAMSMKNIGFRTMITVKPNSGEDKDCDR